MATVRITRSAAWGLTAAITAIVVALAGIALLAVQLRVTRNAEARLADLVSADLAGFADLYAQRRIIAVREAMERRSASADPQAELFVLMDKQHIPLAGNLREWPADLAPDGRIQPFSYDPGIGAPVPFLGAGAELPGGFPMVVARSRAQVDGLSSELRRGSVIALGAIALAGLGAGWIISRRIVARADTLNRVCVVVETGDLSARAPTTGPQDEFGALALHINRMLDRIARLHDANRDLSNAIAHELRTPLNRLMLRAHRLSGVPESDRAAEIEGIVAETRSAIAVFEALLDISATEAAAGDPAGFAPVDLTAVVRDVHDLYDAVADDRQIRLLVDAATPAQILGDRQLLSRMVANLVDNAIKFTPSGGVVTVRVMPGGASHVLSVEDTGPGVPAGMEDRVFDRFVRAGSTAAAPGHGLGLALVRAIAIRHGIRMELKNTGTGLNVRAVCPALEMGHSDGQSGA